MRTTHTYATLAISPAAHAEIRGLLEAAGYSEFIEDDGRVRLDNIALSPTAEPQQVFIVGQYREQGPWTFCGVFIHEADAVARCFDDLHFVGPALLGTALPIEDRVWPGLYWPKRDPVATTTLATPPAP